jgi:hypothetical protein
MSIRASKLAIAGRRLGRFNVALSFAAILALASESFAQGNIVPIFNAAGSSSAFNAFGLAAGLGTAGTGPGICGSNNWTKRSTGQGIDSRSSSIAVATGNIWIVWDNTPEPNRTVCAYLSLDSVIGTRLFLAAPRGTLSLSPSVIGTSGDNLVPFLPPDQALPSNIYNDLNNQPFNAAISVLRPEDALFATTRALAPFTGSSCPTCGLGYGPGPIGTSILSAFSSKSAQVVSFALSGPDPITGQTVLPWTATDVGAQVGVVFVNNQDTSAAGLGNAAFRNVDRFVLAKVYDGTLTRTRDLIPSSGLPAVSLHVLNPEPISGTFNTFEFAIPGSIEINSTQENGVNPALPNNNPLNLSAASGGTRQRIIGTSQMVTEVNSMANSIGYAFWGFGTFSSVGGSRPNSKYLTVDGVDPLFASYLGGAFPVPHPCGGRCCPPSGCFSNVQDGSYPIWNILRATTAIPVPAGISALISAAQAQQPYFPNFVPSNSLGVFRSHYLQSGVLPNNGHTGAPESGGDVGGAVLTVQSDLDFYSDTGQQLTGLRQ